MLIIREEKEEATWVLKDSSRSCSQGTSKQQRSGRVDKAAAALGALSMDSSPRSIAIGLGPHQQPEIFLEQPNQEGETVVS